MVGLETRREEQEELSQLSLKQQQQQPPAAPSPVWTSQLVYPMLETGSERTAQQQPQQQQQLKTEKSFMVELETRGEEQEELLQLPLQQKQQPQPPAAPPRVWTSQLVFPILETGSERTAKQQPQGQQQQFDTGEKG